MIITESLTSSNLDRTCYLPPDFGRLVFSTHNWSPTSCWFRRKNQSPHMKIVMHTAVVGQGGTLLREELITILSLMIHRLKQEEL